MKKLKLDHIDLSDTKKQKNFFRLDLFELVDGSNISLPAAIVGQGEGKLVTIIAAQHGNEWNGTFASHLLYQQLDPAKMQGKVIILPISNPPAFLQRNRVSSIDNIDMNRTYSFIKKRKPTEHLAKIVFEKFCVNADYVIDLHSGGPGEYIPIAEVLNHEVIVLAQSFNLGQVMIRKKDSNSLVPNCEKMGVTAFSIEAGRALKLNYDYSAKISDGITNFLKTVGVLEGEPQTDLNQPVYTGKITLPAEVSGFFKPSLRLGDKIKKGDEICTIWPFFQSESIKISSPVKGAIVYLRADEIINQGESLAHIAE